MSKNVSKQKQQQNIILNDIVKAKSLAHFQEFETLAQRAANASFVVVPHLLRAEQHMSTGDWQGAEEHLKKTGYADAVSNYYLGRIIWESAQDAVRTNEYVQKTISMLEPFNLSRVWGTEESDDEKTIHYAGPYRGIYFEALRLASETTGQIAFVEKAYQILLSEESKEPNRRQVQLNFFKELDLVSLGRVQGALLDYAEALTKERRVVEAVTVLRKLFTLESDPDAKVIPSPIPLNAAIRMYALKLLFKLLTNSTTTNTYSKQLLIDEEAQNKGLKQFDEETRTNVSVKSSSRGAQKQTNQYAYHTPRSLVDEILTLALCLEKSENIWEGLINGLGESGAYKALMPIYKRGLALHSEEKHYWHQFGLILIKSERFAKAVKVLNNCISIDPKDASLYILTAKVCLNHLPDKKKECIGYAKKAVELGGFLSSRSHRILGLACANYAKEATSRTEKQQYQVDALDALQKAYELDKSDYMNAYHLAQQYAELQEIRKAFHYVKKSISLNSGFVDAWMLLALLFTADRSYDKAYKTIANARGQYPNKLRVWYLYARIEEAYESQQRAEKSFKRFSAEIPHLLSLDIQNELKSIISYSDDAKPVKDSSEITAALPTSPQNADDSQMVGLTNYKKQLKCAQYYLLVADAYRRMRLFEDCQKAIRKAHKLVERVVEAVQEINMSRSANVMMSDLKVTEREKQTNEETQPKGMLYGLVDVAVGNHMQSDVIDSEMVHALRSVSAGVHYQQGRYHEERGKEYLSEAIAEYETALVDYPVHKESLLQLGIVQYEQYQKYMLAKSYLQGAVRVDPNFYEAWYHLGMVVKQMGELEESSECFMASLKLEKSAPVVPFDVLLKKKF